MTESEIAAVKESAAVMKYTEERVRTLWRSSHRDIDVRHTCALVLEHLKPSVILDLVTEIEERDGVIHDLLIDAGRISQDATPPDHIRQENVRLRKALEGITLAYADSDMERMDEIACDALGILKRD